MVDLATWNLSIPEGSPPKTIETPRLVDGFQDKYFNSEGSTVYFWSPVTGTKTENAIYPRSELRETYKRPDILVVAGGVIPPSDLEFLKKAGCFDVYGPGTKIPVAARSIINALIDRSS